MGYKYLPAAPYGQWASDDNYAAGANPWNGNPTKVMPTAGELAQGIVPATQVDARHLNWGLNHATGGLGVLAHALMRSWNSYLIKDDATTGTTYEIGGYHDTLTVTLSNSHIVAPYRSALGSGSLVPTAKPTLLALRNLTTTEASIYQSGTGVQWTQPLGSVAFVTEAGVGTNHTFDMCGDVPGNLIVVSDRDRSITRFSDSLAIGDRQTISDVAPSGLGFSAVAAFRALAGWWLLAGVGQTGGTTSSTDRIFRSGDGGGTWAAMTTPSAWNTIPIHAFCCTHAEQGDPASNIALATGEIDGKILRSTDQGLNWSEVTLPAALADRGSANAKAYQLAWSPVHRLFMCINQDFDVAVSADGLNWTVRPGSGGLTAIFTDNTVDRGRMLAAAGPVFALAVNVDGTEGETRSGVFYTLDAGFEWHFVDFAPGGSEPLLGIREWGGALAAVAPGKVYVSPTLWSAPADLDFS